MQPQLYFPTATVSRKSAAANYGAIFCYLAADQTSYSSGTFRTVSSAVAMVSFNASVKVRGNGGDKENNALSNFVVAKSKRKI